MTKSHNHSITRSLFQFLLILSLFTICACKQKTGSGQQQQATKPISSVFENYYEERIKIFPLEATSNGDNRYNDQLPIDISDVRRDTLKIFFKKYQGELSSYNRDSLSDNDRISYDILQWDLQEALDGLQFNDNLSPFNQFWALPLTFAQFGAGQNNQPFKTVKDYENFLGRINGFESWCDTAIANMKKGIEKQWVLPAVLVQRMIPQMKGLAVDDAKKSVFYMPIQNLPKDFSAADKHRLDSLYTSAIQRQVSPSYKRLYDFLEKEYLPHARATAGISAIPGGRAYYDYLIRYWTTTNMTADQVFDLGQEQVKHLKEEMEKVKTETGFKGDLKAFFKYVNTDKKFMPYKTEKEVLDAHRAIEGRMQPQLKKLFGVVPKTPFEIRQTEKFREASASPEYNQGTADGSRPGIFFVPNPEPKKFNSFGMESLFLHEAIPGHHYQISLQQENTSLPKFRRYTWYGAYGEGWALYSESLGKELGLYTDPYQYFGSLSEEMHRAIRLVVDVGLHVKGWTREQAIQFSMENEGESEQGITSEIERYMAIPGQALSYKVGQLKIREIRKRAEDALGSKFSISKFHDELLNDGCLPLAVLETKMNRWVEKQK